MKICKNCNVAFPFLINIDGKKRNLKNRKYCLICSPFGIHNTKKLHNKTENITNYCSWHTCKKPLGGNQTKYCSKKCKTKTLVNNHRCKLKDKAIHYRGGQCEICGYKNCIAALEFHHKNNKQKNFGISKSGCTRSWEKIQKELDLCILVCSNCHKEIHWKTVKAGNDPATYCLTGSCSTN